MKRIIIAGAMAVTSCGSVTKTAQLSKQDSFDKWCYYMDKNHEFYSSGNEWMAESVMAKIDGYERCSDRFEKKANDNYAIHNLYADSANMYSVKW